MKRVLFLLFCLALIVPAHPGFAQNKPFQNRQDEFTKDVQNLPPETAAQINQAIQRGDFQGAKKIYSDYKKSKEAHPVFAPTTTEAAPQPVEAPRSLFERTLSGEFPSDILLTGLQQFGYDMFLKSTSTFVPSAFMPVGPDYIIGPGDQFTLTLWGTTEGIYSLSVTKEGNITLPKVGVVPVTGIRFGELEKTLRRHLSKYYSDFNLSVAMGALKTITVYVVGEVANPGSYSLPSLTTLYGALFAAGGPTKKGSMRSIQILRSGRAIKTVDLYDFLLRGDRSQDIRLQHEDTVFVPLVGPLAGVAGTVYRPAIYELKGQETIGDLVRTAGGIMPIALASRVQLYRFSDNQKRVVLDIQTSDPPGDAQSRKNNRNELREKVQNMDLIKVLPIYDKVWETVNLQGDVRHPGDFQWRPDLRLKEVVLLGQLLPTSDLQKAEVIRLKEDFKDREIIPVNLAALMAGDESQNILLRPKDQVRIYTMYREAEKITVSGEVMRPGTYEIFKGERLSDLLRRAGGFTPEAYPYGAVFKRKDVKNAQAKNMQSFIARMQSQILQTAAGGAATAVSGEEATFTKTEMTLNQSILENLKTMQEQFEGRVAVNITENIDQWAGSKDDLLLQDGDTLLIPKRPQEVMIMGEVHSPGAQVFLPGLRVRDYLNQSGGATSYADSDQIFVVKASGFALSSDSPSVGNIEKMRLTAGDTIFVPQKMERHATMRATKDIIDILFKTAVVLATIVVIF